MFGGKLYFYRTHLCVVNVRLLVQTLKKNLKNKQTNEQHLERLIENRTVNCKLV